MTIQEVRNHEEYKRCFEKIRSYKKGFEFVINYSEIPTPQANALQIVLDDAINFGYLESLRSRTDLYGKLIAERFRKI